MRLRWFALLILCSFGLVANTVKVQLLAHENHPKQKIPFVLIFEVPQDSHIYGPDDLDSPTILTWKLPKGVVIERLQWPALQNLKQQDHTFKGYE